MIDIEAMSGGAEQGGSGLEFLCLGVVFALLQVAAIINGMTGSLERRRKR